MKSTSLESEVRKRIDNDGELRQKGRSRLLLVSDDAVKISLISGMLDGDSDIALSAASLDLAKLSDLDEFDAMMLDVDMDRAVEEVERFLAKIPVIAISNNYDESAETELIAKGFHCYISKDVLIPQALKHMVKTAARRQVSLNAMKKNISAMENAALLFKLESDLLNAIMENTDTQLAYLDNEFNFVRVNSAYANGSGHSAEELIGRNHFDLFPDEENMRIFESVRDTGKPVKFKAKPFVFRDQPERGVTYWDWSLNPVKDRDGCVQGMVLSLADVTASKKTEKDLLDSESKLGVALKNSMITVVVVDNDMRISWISNPPFGMRSEDVTGKLISEIIPARYSDELNAIRKDMLAKRSGAFQREVRLDLPSGTWFLDATVDVLRNSAGDAEGLLISAIDVTKRKLLEETVRNTDERFRVALANSQITLCCLDKDLRITWVHNTPHGYMNSDVIGKRFDEFIPSPYGEELLEVQRKVLETGSNDRREVEAKTPMETWLFDMTTEPMKNERGEITGLILSMMDITDSRRAERALRESEMRFQNVLETSLDAAYRRDLVTDTYDYISPVIEKITGFAAKEFAKMSSRDTIARVHPDDAASVEASIGKAMNGGPNSCLSEYRFMHKDGSYRWVSDSFTVVKNSRGLEYRIGIVRDITERKKAEELINKSEKRLRSLAENAPDVIMRFDRDFRVIYINPQAEDATGMPPEKFIGKTNEEIGMPKDLCKKWREMMKAAFLTGKKQHLVFDFPSPEGKKTFSQIMVPELSSNGTVDTIMGISHDITKEKEDMERVKKSLEEKDILLAEINHRVKNNLQMISSLLHLEAMKSKEGSAILKESQNRIKSIALVHEILYKTKDFSSINISQYFKELAKRTAETMGMEKISISVDADDITLKMGTAIPCGIIVNELVMNSIKHAFPDKKGRIKIALHENGSGVELSVRDNGIGMPSDFDMENTKSLGLKLVKSLAEQLDGKMEFVHDNGTVFKIVFPNK
jgi:PAS domain S-box-containing protein